MKNAVVFKVVLAFAVLVAGALALYRPAGTWRRGDGSSVAKAPKSPAPSVQRSAIPIDGDPSLGPEHALVTLVELGDFDCDNTLRAEPIVQRLRAKYGNDLRLVWKDAPLPLHRNALPAAMMAHAAAAQLGPAAFWRAHDKLLARTRALDADALLTIANEVGFDQLSALQLFARPELDAAIEADLSLARGLRATSTPQFLVNGRLLRGPVSFETLQALIDEELAAARALAARGIARGQVYGELMAKADVVREPPGPPRRIDRERQEATERRAELMRARRARQVALTLRCSPAAPDHLRPISSVNFGLDGLV